MMKRFLMSLPLVCGSLLFADVKLPAMFTEHAVLVKSEKTPIFGKADVGEKVEVTLGNATGSAVAGAEGKWRINLDASKLGDGPYKLTVKGKNTIEINDIVFGEVWLCSGQSNMHFTLKGAEGGKEIIAASANPKIRYFRMACKSSTVPLDDVSARWVVAGPENAGGFSAVGYLFGREIQNATGKYVGLMDNSWGGSGAEAWMTVEALSKDPDVKKYAEEQWNNYVNYVPNRDKYLEAYLPWIKSTGRDTPTADAPPADAKWTKAQPLAHRSFGGNGIVWFRKTFTLNEKQVKNNQRFNLGQFGAFVTAYLDGKKIAENTHAMAIAGDYLFGRIPANSFTAGEHVMTLRCNVPDDKFRMIRPGNLGGSDFHTGWETTTVAYPKLTAEQKAARPKRPPFISDTNKVPSLLYNALIAPLFPYSISGSIWYQGETNSGRAAWYPVTIQEMIKEWRKGFESEFPFYYCQLANFSSKTNKPGDAGWAAIRVGQEGALALPKTGQAVIIDVGEANDIHPLDKLTVGKRLAAIALHNDYGFKDMVYSGPVCIAKNVEGSKIRLKFDHVHAGLEARPVPATYFKRKTANETAPTIRNSPNSQLEGFAVSDKDGNWYWADAKIDGNDVLVWSDNVAAPVKVRYAFSSNPTCNLYNKDGFPAVPFEK